MLLKNLFTFQGRKIKEFSQKVIPVVRGTCGIVNDLAMLNDQLQGQDIQQFQNNEQILPQESYPRNQNEIPNTPAAFKNIDDEKMKRIIESILNESN